MASVTSDLVTHNHRSSAGVDRPACRARVHAWTVRAPACRVHRSALQNGTRIQAGTGKPLEWDRSTPWGPQLRQAACQSSKRSTCSCRAGSPAASTSCGRPASAYSWPGVTPHRRLRPCKAGGALRPQALGSHAVPLLRTDRPRGAGDCSVWKDRQTVLLCAQAHGIPRDREHLARMQAQGHRKRGPEREL